MSRFGSPIESNHRYKATGFNPLTEQFEFTTARQPLPCRAALTWSSLAGLACFLILIFGVGV